MYVFVCVFCLFGQMHRPIFGFLSVIKVSVDVEQIHGPCLISLCFSPHPSGPALHPFPPPWQHPKQPALITTHPSIRTLLRPGQVSSPGEIGQARSQRMDEDRVRYQQSLKGRALVWGFGVEGMCQLLYEECCYSWNQHVQTKRHTHIHSKYLFPDTHNSKYIHQWSLTHIDCHIPESSWWWCSFCLMKMPSFNDLQWEWVGITMVIWLKCCQKVKLVMIAWLSHS